LRVSYDVQDAAADAAGVDDEVPVGFDRDAVGEAAS
jgi:hypothetical protein